MSTLDMVEDAAHRAGIEAERLGALVLEAYRSAAAQSWPHLEAKLETSWDARGEVELRVYQRVGTDLTLEDARRCGLDDDPTSPLQEGDELGLTVFYREGQRAERELQRAQFGALLPFEQPEGFGRRAAVGALKALQRVARGDRENTQRESFEPLAGRVVVGMARRHERGALILDLGGVEARLPASAGGSDVRGRRVLALVQEVRGRDIVLTRRGDAFVRELVRLEVPEVERGEVEVVAVARDERRVKVAVRGREGSDLTPTQAVDLVVGEHGAHADALADALAGVQLDVVPWDADPVRGAIAALAGAEVLDVDEIETGVLAVRVAADDVRRAVGARGANARLAAALYGWRELRVLGTHEEPTRSGASCTPSSETTSQDEGR